MRHPSAKRNGRAPRRPRSGPCAAVRELGIDFYWDAEVARTPEGFYQVRGGLDYAIRRTLSVAPYADLVWMETASADIHKAQEFAEAIHAEFPDKMLAYNLSPSFNWDSTGMTDDEMREFPKKLGEAGFVFNFITYGGHQIDGVATEGPDGPSRGRHATGPGSGPTEDPPARVALPNAADPRRRSSPRRRLGAHHRRAPRRQKAMGKGSTQVQHLAQTELPKKVARGLARRVEGGLRHQGAPHGTPAPDLRDGADVLELAVLGTGGDDDRKANLVFAPTTDRHGQVILSVRDQNTFDSELRQKRLMTLLHLYVLKRYRVTTVHYVTPTEDNDNQTKHGYGEPRASTPT